MTQTFAVSGIKLNAFMYAVCMVLKMGLWCKMGGTGKVFET